MCTLSVVMQKEQGKITGTVVFELAALVALSVCYVASFLRFVMILFGTVTD